MSETEPEENPETAVCEYTGEYLRRDHPVFAYQSEMKMAQASIGLAIAEGVRLQASRELLDMLDTLYQIISDQDSRLPDQQRKMLNHADDVWLDMKDKMSKGDKRAAFLLEAHSHMDMALSHLVRCREDQAFKEMIPDYLLKYLGKLSTFTYREAIGHVML